MMIPSPATGVICKSQYTLMTDCCLYKLSLESDWDRFSFLVICGTYTSLNSSDPPD